MSEEKTPLTLKLKFNNTEKKTEEAKKEEKLVDKPITNTEPIFSQAAKSQPITPKGLPQIVQPSIQKAPFFKKKVFIPKHTNDNKFAPAQKPFTPRTSRPPFNKFEPFKKFDQNKPAGSFNKPYNNNGSNHFKPGGNTSANKFNKFEKTGLNNKPLFEKTEFRPNFNKTSPINKIFTPNLFEKKSFTDFSKKKKTTKKEISKPKTFGAGNFIGTKLIGRIDELDHYSDLERMKKYQNKKSSSVSKPKIFLHKNITINQSMSLKELASEMSIKIEDLIHMTKTMGFEGSELLIIEPDIAQIIIESFGHKAIRADQLKQQKLQIGKIEINEESAVKKPPIVTIVGHVDHGKTSLLDKIRKSNLTKSEAGGITQSIGAYSVKTKNGKLTFLDTPGHEAFIAMRKRGININDITILVIAGTEGIKNQTIEAIKAIKESKTQLIIAATKCDLPDFNLNKLQQELLRYEIITKEFGGEIEIIEVSSVTGKNIDLLLETILTYADLMELKANTDQLAIGVVLESRINPKSGVITSLLIQQGTLKIGDLCIAGKSSGKIKGIWNDLGEAIKEAGPSTPIEILGLDKTSIPGEVFAAINDHNLILEMINHKEENEDHFVKKTAFGINTFLTNTKPCLNIILKAETQGSLEAIKFSLENLKQTNSRIEIISSSIGNIKESDIELAKLSKSKIIGFNTKASKDILHLANTEKIEIIENKIIYHLIEIVEKELFKLIKPIEKQVYQGKAKVLMIFSSSKLGNISGSIVTDGKITKNSIAKLFRKGKLIFTGTVQTLKRFKDDVREVNNGFECGIFINYPQIMVDDEIECYSIEYETPEN